MPNPKSPRRYEAIAADIERTVAVEDKRALRAHVRSDHANLLGQGPGVAATFSRTSLPEAGLNHVPYMWLDAIHRACHLGNGTDLSHACHVKPTQGDA